MNFDALFKPRILPTLQRRITYLVLKFKDQDQVYIDPGELVQELGHAQSAHGVAMRQFLEQAGDDSSRHVYKLNKIALKHLIRTIRERNEESERVATVLRQELVQTTLELAVAKERLDTIDSSHGKYTENEKLFAAATVLFIEQDLKNLGKCSEMNHVSGALAALELRESLKDQFLQTKNMVIGQSKTLSVG